MKDPEERKFEKWQANRRFWLSIIIVIASIGILVLVTLLDFDENKGLSPETIFTAIVGLVGSWVGAIIAFYYTKDNFESASRNTQNLVSQISKRSLDQILAKDTMIGLSQMNYLVLEEGKKESDYKLKDLLDKYFENFNRLPVFASNKFPRYVIHRSMIDKFLSRKLFNTGDEKVDPDKLSLQSMLEDKDYEKMIKAFVTGSREDTLSTIKNRMDAIVIEQSNNDKVYIADAFITESGTAKSPVIGWITNVEINKKSKV